ncbi:MAG: M15 family metallopeptidase [Synergistaceae bacterium]|nr:M15 family metallopeptidase [Synergistaceae bacterium]
MKKFMAILVVLLLAAVSFAEEGFTVSEITPEIFARIQGKSYKDNCPIPLEDLRYLRVLHKDINGETHEGEMVCSVHIASDVLEIFKALYEAGYPIERVRLVDEYDADDETSMRDNNSSCFNFRFITHSTKISKHGLGLAVDINTLYNPYVKETKDGRILEPATAGEYVDRTKSFPYKIEKGDLCYRLFIECGFEWGGEWKSLKDYQHFEVSDERARELYPDYR